MKKIICFIILLLYCLVLSSCNMSCGLGNFNFNKIHCITTNECYTIKSWRNNEMGIEVNTKEYGSLYFSEGTYIMIEDECPICDKEK